MQCHSKRHYELAAAVFAVVVVAVVVVDPSWFYAMCLPSPSIVWCREVTATVWCVLVFGVTRLSDGLTEVVSSHAEELSGNFFTLFRLQFFYVVLMDDDMRDDGENTE